MQKMKAANLGGAYRHNERVFENHSNKDIDTGRSYLNYELTNRDCSVSYEKQIKVYVNENKVSKRAIRKDAVLCAEWIITSDKAFFDNLNEEQTRRFFETAKNYFAENYGEANIAYASVHLDESTPHMHMGIVPFKNGKLSAKAMFTREELKKIQDDFPKYMNENGFKLSRGQLKSDRKHLSVADYKAKIGEEALNQELLGLGAPRYWHEEEERPATDDEVEWYESLEALFSDEEFNIREATLEERFKWLNNHREDLKENLGQLEELVDEKIKKYTKINSKTSKSLSKLGKIQNDINTLEKYSEGLESKIEGLESESQRLSNGVMKLERAHRQETQLLLQQSDSLKKISFQDLDRRQEAKELHDELALAKPKRFGDSFSFSTKFVKRLKAFVFDITEKLEQAINQNEVLRRSLKGMTEAKKRVENELQEVKNQNQDLSNIIEEQKTQNEALKTDNNNLKGSKKLIEDLQDVLTRDEVISINKRLESLREAREAPRKRYEPKQNKGRSI